MTAPTTSSVGDGVNSPVFLGEVWDTELAPTIPTLVGVGESHLLFGGMSHAIYAPSGAGKTWLALAMLLDVVRATARPALLLDREASLPVMVNRARQVGATGEDARRLAYWQLDGPLGARRDDISRWVAHYQPALVILDGVTDACASDGVDADADNAGYTRWHRMVEAATGADGQPDSPALLLIDHVSEKTGGDRLYGRGVTAKRDAITGAAYRYQVTTPLSPSSTGTGTLVTAKCRHQRATGEVAAKVRLAPAGDPGRSLHVELQAPDRSDAAAAAAADGLESTIDGVLAALADGPKHQRTLTDQVRGDDKRVRRAIARLEQTGRIERDPTGPARGGYHPYRLATATTGPVDAG